MRRRIKIAWGKKNEIKAEEPKVETNKDIWEVGYTPTNVEYYIVNKISGDKLDIHTAMAKMLNDLEEIKLILK